MTMREYGSDREYPANDCLSKQEQVMDIHIKPKMRYLVVSAFIPVVMYLGAFFLSFYLPPGYHWALQVLVGIMVLTALAVFWSVLSLICTSWTLTPDQIRFKRGVIARRTDYLELYRVTDYMVKESVVERALGICSFYVVSTDATSPVMHIYGIPNLRELQIELRTRVERQRQLKRIYEIGNHN